MPHHALRWGRTAILAAACAGFAACNSDDTTSPTIPPNHFAKAQLVADATGMGATNVDPALVNPWGLAFGPTGILWVGNNETGTSTLYDGSGVKQSTVVNIPTSTSSTGGKPTGVVFNGTGSFTIPSSGAAAFIFAGEDGTISAWNSTTGNAKLVADRSSGGAVYKGIAIALNGGTPFLYATDFKNNRVDIFDGNFQFVRSFTDANIPSGYGPFGIQAIGVSIYVTYAKQAAPDNEDDVPGAGNGYVDVFNPDGTVAKRFASNGNLNAPWAITMAPSTFGKFGNDILVANFGDGKIGVYDPNTGAFIDFLRDATDAPIVIDGVWGLAFAPSSSTLWFSAGPGDEAHGLLGTITP